ncbi:uncharacterized protein isoform X2 [Choristoneura fumiferana]|uniref:uncharacterized protein isoform X2 n=1 Tax=Choristoneura fumiferana TaxID=7141 RepID=UPI003D159C01
MNKITFVLLLVALFAIAQAHPQVNVVDGQDQVHVVDGQDQVHVVDGDNGVNVVDGPDGGTIWTRIQGIGLTLRWTERCGDQEERPLPSSGTLLQVTVSIFVLCLLICQSLQFPDHNRTRRDDDKPSMLSKHAFSIEDWHRQLMELLHGTLHHQGDDKTNEDKHEDKDKE